jgi:protein-L-isoaspartate(D-aspartate) O-methyltransferase
VLAQLKDGGKIACLFAEGALGTVKIGYKLDGRLDWRASFNAGAPTLDGFQRHRAFTL